MGVTLARRVSAGYSKNVDVLIFLFFILVLPAILILKFLDKRNPERKKKKFLDTGGSGRLFDLKLFGWKPNPWVAVILGTLTYLVGGNLGGTLQPIGTMLIILGGIKIVGGLFRHKAPSAEVVGVKKVAEGGAISKTGDSSGKKPTATEASWNNVRAEITAINGQMEKKEILPGLDVASYQTVGEWYHEAKRQGYSVPLELCMGVEKLMEKQKLGFPEAFRLLEGKGMIKLIEGFYVFDLSATRLWEGKD